jgi:hypothetical protein
VIGPPGQTDLVDSGTYGPPVYGADRIGGAVSVIQRSTNPKDTGTLWAATGAGRIFITKNADDAASSVSWTRIDGTSAVSPSRFPSGIYVDPRNKNHAWVSYSGYNVNTPATPGHVFDVTWNGAAATFTDISYNCLTSRSPASCKMTRQAIYMLRRISASCAWAVIRRPGRSPEADYRWWK